MGGDEPFHGAAPEGDPSGIRNELTERRDGQMTDLGRESFRTSFDSRTESAGTAVVSAVAAVSNTEPLKMAPLHTVLDIDALDALFRPGSDGYVRFTFNEHEVVVRSDETITVTPDAG